MKRFLYGVFVSLLMLSVLALPVFAASEPGYTKNEDICFSDDLSSLNVGNKNYSRFNITNLDVWFDQSDEPIYAKLDDNQSKSISYAQVEFNSDRSVAFLSVFYLDGAQSSAYYLRDDCRKAYEDLMQGFGTVCVVDFTWPEGNEVKTSKSKLIGEPSKLFYSDIYDFEDFLVTTKSAKGDFAIQDGVVVMPTSEETCYFVDFIELGIFDVGEFYGLEGETIPCYEITDEALKEKLLSAKEEYYSSDFGIFENESITKIISAFIFVIGFFIFPVVALVFSIVIAVRSKKFYRKMFTWIAVLCGFELIMFFVLLSIALLF